MHVNNMYSNIQILNVKRIECNFSFINRFSLINRLKYYYLSFQTQLSKIDVLHVIDLCNSEYLFWIIEMSENITGYIRSGIIYHHFKIDVI